MLRCTHCGGAKDKGESLLKKSGDWECRFCMYAITLGLETTAIDAR